MIERLDEQCLRSLYLSPSPSHSSQPILLSLSRQWLPKTNLNFIDSIRRGLSRPFAPSPHPPPFPLCSVQVFRVASPFPSPSFGQFLSRRAWLLSASVLDDVLMICLSLICFWPTISRLEPPPPPPPEARRGKGERIDNAFDFHTGFWYFNTANCILIW